MCFPAELPILFGTHYEYRGNSTDFEWEVAGLMQGMLKLRRSTALSINW